MPTFPAATAISNAANQGTAKTLFEDWLATTKQLSGAAARSTIVIASDQATPTQFAHKIDTESSAATDDLKQVLQGNLPDGSLLLLSIVSAARTVRVWNAAGGTGQITLKSGDNFYLADPSHYLLLLRSGSTWEEIERFPNAPLVPYLTKNANYTLALADRGKALYSLGNDWTLALPSITSAGSGFEINIINRTDTGIMTIDPNGSDSIDEKPTIKLHPQENVRAFSNGVNGWTVLSRTKYRPARGYRFGLTVSNDGTDPTNDLVIAGGECASSDADVEDRATITIPSAYIKQIDAVWAAGSGAGGRIAAESLVDGTWHVYAFRRSNGLGDVCFSQSLNPTLPDSGTHRRRIASWLRESGAMVPIFQYGNYFRRRTSILDLNVTNPGTSAATRTLSIPTGIELFAFGTGFVGAGTASASVILTDLESTDQAPSSTVAPLAFAENTSAKADYFSWMVRTNTSRQIRSRLTGGDSSTVLRLSTDGWYDPLGMLF